MKILICLLALFTTNLAFAKTFDGTFWSKQTMCASAAPECLPSQTERPTRFNLPEFLDYSPVELKIWGKEYLVEIFIAVKEGNPDYAIFQTTVKTLTEKVIAICSRYEALDSLESIPVGSCGGAHTEKENTLVGFSISL